MTISVSICDRTIFHDVPRLVRIIHTSMQRTCYLGRRYEPSSPNDSVEKPAEYAIGAYCRASHDLFVPGGARRQ